MYDEETLGGYLLLECLPAFMANNDASFIVCSVRWMITCRGLSDEGYHTFHCSPGLQEQVVLAVMVLRKVLV